jgi:NAD(P)H-hydrate repair Nnr-like enzyme with NAD(P)H-hydrate dehydratase domain
VQLKVDLFETAVAAVYLSGLAGDLAEAKYDKRVMTASDVRDSLLEAFELIDGEGE